MSTKATLFIVDDHQLVIDGILAMLQDDPEWEIIGYANTGEEAIKKIPLLRPDVVLMDLEMPGLNGFQTTEKLLTCVKGIRIVILTLHHEKAVAQKLIKLGACGYILKTASRQEFLHGLNAVRQGINYYSPQLTETALEVSSLEIKNEANVKLMALLSEREREVLQLVAEGASSKEMATRLHLSAATVETHRKNLLKKLNARNSAELIRLAITEGLIVSRK